VGLTKVARAGFVAVKVAEVVKHYMSRCRVPVEWYFRSFESLRPMTINPT
jgi:hypothetical protein